MEKNYTIVRAKVRDEQKRYGDWQEFRTATVNGLEGFAAGSKKVEYSRYGGWKEYAYEAAGYFYVKQVGDRWWLVDPEGHPFIHIALVNVSPGRSKNNKAALVKKYGEEKEWALQTIPQLKEYGFNGAGAWTNNRLIRQVESPLVYTCIWDFMSSYGKERGGIYQLPGHIGYPYDCIFVFDPGFGEFCDRHAAKLLETKDDPYLLGHFSDNELPFPEDLLDKYLSLDKTDWGYIEAKKWLDNRKGRSADISDIKNEDRDDFCGFVADRYFEITCNAIRKYDPNHLCMGSRFYGPEKDNAAVFAAAGKHLDVVSVNYYNVWTPENHSLRNWAKWSGKPVMITEWYTKGADTGMVNSSGAGWIVETQRDRGLFYQNYTIALLESKVCVGWHWFKYMDNDPEDLTMDPSNRDSNKGVVNNWYEAYGPLLEKMREMNREVYPIIDFIDKIE